MQFMLLHCVSRPALVSGGPESETHEASRPSSGHTQRMGVCAGLALIDKACLWK